MTTAPTSSTSSSNNQHRVASALAVGFAPVGLPVPEGRITFFEAAAQSPESSSPDGKTFPEKAVAFWARKAVLRRTPLHCGRCAKPNANGLRQCDACRQWAASYRASKRIKPVTVDASALAQIEARVAKVEHNLAMMQLAGRLAYKRGFGAGARATRKAMQTVADVEPITHQEMCAHGLRVAR